MHILVTDRVSCARCGPEFGLILRADRLESRRVLEGRLACLNCRTHYRVSQGFADLRSPGGEAPPKDPLCTADPDEALRLRALLGRAPAAGPVALVGAVAGLAGPLSELMDGVEILALHPELRERAETEGVSRLAAGIAVLPFLSASLGGIVVRGTNWTVSIRELRRALAPGSRLVCQFPGDRMRAAMEATGLDPVTEFADVVVGVRK